MSIKNKLLNIASTHPRIVTTTAIFAIGLAITVIVGSVTEMFDHGQVAFAGNNHGGAFGPPG